MYEAQAFVVLIDPGHGGDELGAVAKVGGRNIYEKDLSLILSKKILNHLPKNVVGYLTRSYDRKVTLLERSKMADAVKADLFISVHFNSAQDSGARGFEIYYLDNHDDLAIKKVEDIENKDLDTKDAIINQILIDLVISKTVSASKSLATKLNKELNYNIKNKFTIKDRGVKPGLFYVLALSKRPGVLLEVGFMSNKEELAMIRRGVFLDLYARSIAQGIVNYIKTLPPSNVPLL